MNYYSIEFFKYCLKLLKKESCNKKVGKIINLMQVFLMDREKNNAAAYSKKWMKKPVFEMLK